MTVTTEEFLEHYGVKGMKWGVRRENRLQRTKRVASGKASRSERARFALGDNSAARLARTGSTQASAKVRVKELEARKKKIKAGRATVRDALALYGADRLHINKDASKKIAKNTAKYSAAQKKQAKINAKMDAGEIAVTALIGGPVGIAGRVAVRRRKERQKLAGK